MGLVMDGAAVWVQAIGSILAIWAAARLVVFQQRSQAVERLEAIYGLAVTSAEQIDTAASVVREAAQFGPEVFADYPVRRLRYAEAGLAAVPLHELRSPMLLGLLVDLQQLVGETRQEMETWRKETLGRGPDRAVVEAFGATAADAAIIVDGIRQLAHAARRRTRLSWLW